MAVFAHRSGWNAKCDCVCLALCFVGLPCLCLSAAWQTGGYTPLFAASQHGRFEVVRALVGAGAAVNQAKVRVHCWSVVSCRFKLGGPSRAYFCGVGSMWPS
jgi:hypothetical protein